MKQRHLKIGKARRWMLLLLLLPLVAGEAYASYDFSAVCSGKTLYFSITNATNRYVKITYPGSNYSNGWSGYTKPSGTLTIPTSVTNGGKTYTITEIGEFAFYQCTNLSGNLVVPNSIVTIGQGAFNGCYQFTGSLTIGTGVTNIGSTAFNNTSFGTLYFNATNCESMDAGLQISSLSIGSNVQRIPNYMCKNCTLLSGSLTIPSSVTSIGTEAFNGCSRLTGSLNLQNVTTIDYRAFYGCSGFTGTLTLSNSLSAIGPHAFYNCSGFTGNLNLPNSLTSIGAHAFFNCGGFTGSLNIPSSLTIIEDGIFGNCSGITGTITIPSSITSMGQSSFSGCDFNTLYFNATQCTSMGGTSGYSPFRNCPSFTILVIGDNVLSIPNYAFYQSDNLTDVYIGSSVGSIGYRAFWYCSKISYIYSDAVNPPTADNYSVFTNIPTTIPIYVPCGSESSYRQASGWSDFSHIFGQPSHILTAVSQDTYKGTAEVTQVPSCGNNVSAIVSATANVGYGFSNWIENGSVVSTENPYSFTLSNDRKLVANFVTIPAYTVTVGTNPSGAGTVTGGGRFNQGTEITVRANPNNNYVFLYWREGNTIVSTNAEYTFVVNAQRSLTAYFAQIYYDFSAVCSTGQTLYYKITDAVNHKVELTCPSTPDFSNGWSGFEKPTGEIVFPSSVTYNNTTYTVSSIGNYAFTLCNGLTGSLMLPNSITSIGNSAFYECSGFSGSLVLPNSLNSIGTQTFIYCSGFTGTLTIPNSVTSISTSAFRNCTGLTSVVFNATNCSTMGSAANPVFNGCTNFETLIIGDNVTKIPNYAFYGCNKINCGITIPNSVNSIGNYAFNNCSNLSSIELSKSTPPTISSNSFSGVPTTIPVHIPCGALAAYQAATGWSNFTNYQEDFDYTLAVSSANTSMGNATITQQPSCGVDAIVTATPNTGYQFVNWKKGNTVVSTDAVYTFTVTEDVTLVANFATSSYTISATANPAVGGTVTGAGEYNHGANVTLSASANEGYNFVNWTENDVEVSTSPTYSFTASADRTLVANFTINSSVISYVSTSPTNRNVILEEFAGRNCGYDPDAHVIVNQIAENNPDRFWAINVHAGGFSPTSYPNLNTEDGSIICNQGFNCTGFPGGVINRSTASSIGRSQWASESDTQFAQVAEVNVAGACTLDYISREATIIVEVYYTGNSSSATNYLTVAMLQDSIIGDQSGMNSNPSQVINGEYCHMHVLRDIITPTWGESISSTTQGTFITRTYTYTIPETIGSPNGVAVDLNNIYFLAWVSEQYQGTPTRPILNACEIEIDHTDQYQLNVSASPSNGGTVTGAGWYNSGQSVTVTATAVNGYIFDNWTENGEIVSEDASYTFAITSGRNLIANFSAYYMVSALATPSDGGTISGTGIYSHNEIATLSAIANEGYTFVNWSIGCETLDFERGIPSNWATIDADGDGYTWRTNTELANLTGGHNGSTNFVLSQSYDNSCGVLDPDNYLVSPQVTLIDGSTFSFWACAQDANYAAEHFGVAISTNSQTNPEDFTLLADWTISSNRDCSGNERGNSKSQTEWRQYTVDLSEYAGRDCFIAIRHFNCSNQFVLNVDDVELVIDSIVSEEATYSFPVTEDVTLTANFARTSSYTISASANPSVGGTVTGAGEYNHGANVTLSASANEGYTFINWTENDEIVSTDATYIFTATADRELVANFTTSGLHWTYDISQFEDYMSVRGVVQIDGIEQRRTDLELGAFCGDECRGAKLAAYFPPMDKYIYQLPVYGNNGDVISFKLYDHQLGMELELTPPANVDYQLNGYGTLGNPYVFNFVSKVEISATANPAEAGTVSGTGDYAIGSTATLTATANENYAFDRWTDNGQTVSTDASYSFTVTEARVLTAEFNYVQTLSLPNGWNWISANVELSDIDGLSILEQGVGENGEMIRTRNGQSVDYFEGYGWWGDLTSINNEEMYEVKTKANCNVPIEGQLCNPENHPITINYGWNWIGCPIQNDVLLSTGLSDLNCYTDDIMKSHFAFSSYFEGFGWYGDVEMLNPGTGYKFYSNGNVQQTFVYQTGSRNQSAIHTSMKERHFKVDATLHKDNMSVIAVTLLDGVELKSSDYELAAFVSGECRGSVRLLDVEPLNRHLAYLTILGENNDQISYRLYDVATGISYQSDSSQDTVFSTDAIIGTQLIPNEIRFSSSNSDNIAVCELNLYPNPINRNETFVVAIPLAENEEAVIEVCNVLGEKLIRTEVAQSSIELKGPSTTGIYQIKAVVGKRVYYGKLIVK